MNKKINEIKRKLNSVDSKEQMLFITRVHNSLPLDTSEMFVLALTQYFKQVI